jgi:hypothetical protein
VLNGIKVRDQEQADDMLRSTTTTGVQMLLNSFYDWASANFVELNASKTYWSFFGPKPRVIPTLYIAQSALEYKTKLKYIGMHLSNTTHLFRDHYYKKASQARYTAHAVLHVESMIGCLPDGSIPISSTECSMSYFWIDDCQSSFNIVFVHTMNRSKTSLSQTFHGNHFLNHA